MADGFWFYAIVLGAAFAQVSRDLALQVRDTVRESHRSIFWPTLLWQVFLLLLCIEVFIAVAAYTSEPQDRSVLNFMAFLAIPVGIFIASLLLEGGPDEALDPQRCFARSRKVLFAIVIALPAMNIVHEAILGEAGLDGDLLFQVLLIIGGVIGFFVRSTRADVVLAVAMNVVIATYIGTLYSTVRF
ncbi:MAG: hypothetical protein B7C55_05865 [Actinomycetales bacterium mxb001]|nr:MAG: hypothetical protein B7C55_05865 [Actinomycetales bacterium mxb001]